MSKASDARSPQGDNIYYKNQIKTYSQYLYWGSHETNNIYDRDSNASGGFGLSGVNREFDLIKSDNSLNNLDDPTGLNPLAVPLVGTKGRATLRLLSKVALMVTPSHVLTSWVHTALQRC